MIDLESTMRDHERYRQALSRANDANKRTVFDALCSSNITAVQVDFDGGGDSGQIESVAAFAGDQPADLPEATVTLQAISWGTAETSTRPTPLTEAIEHICYSYLGETHGGWENNDGAYGQFQFDVGKRTIELEFNGRFTDTWTDTHTF